MLPIVTACWLPRGQCYHDGMNWQVKGVVQRILGSLPWGGRLNDVLQRRVGGLRKFDSSVDSKVVDDWVVFATILRDLGYRTDGLQLLEVGTGWFPTLPLCFALAGARSCHTYDLDRHLSRPLSLRMLHRLRAHVGTIAAAAGLSVESVHARYRHYCEAQSIEELLQRANVGYFAPADASRTFLPDASIDVVFSNSVLEHVEPASILSIMRETNRVLRPKGVAVHSVNCDDHYAYFDRSITQINYLKYSDRQWRLWDNRLLYQNRLRATQFLRLAGDAGLSIVTQESRAEPALLSQLKSMVVSPRFDGFSAEDLCTTSITFVARPTETAQSMPLTSA